MINILHPNYIKSSNLIFASAGLGIINFLILPNMQNSVLGIVTIIIVCSFIVGLGFLVRSGKEWVKYLLLALSIIGLVFGFPEMLNMIKINIIAFIINIIQTVFQIWATVLLFKVHKLNE